MLPDLEKLILMRETDARRALGDTPIHFSVLAPLGGRAGRGALRVLRARPAAARDGEQVELVCGYEAYDRI